MRETKYKAWDRVNKAMRDVWSITWDFTPQKPTEIIACNPVINSEYILHEGQFDLLEYTGLTDKNGREIYEGDIIKMAVERSYKFGDIGYILYEEDFAGFISKSIVKKKNQDYERLDCDIACECETIGNIYEHSHLISHNQ
jgi:uncharacterized phage protein (TIGR01671 family)